MRIVFFGTAEFAVPALESLAGSVALSVSQPDRPSGRGLNLRPSPVRARALELGIPTAAPESCRDEAFIASIEALKPDFLVVAAYGQIMPQRLLDAGAQGAFNLHGSILPSYRGAAPIQRAIEHGDAETGVTLMQMSRKMDAGDIIDIDRTLIGADETAGELTPRLAKMAAELVTRWADRLAGGDYPREPQDEALVTFAPKIDKAEAELTFDLPISHAYRRFRAFTPAPGAFVRTSKGRLKLTECRAIEDPLCHSGTIVALRPELALGFSGGALIISRLQPEGQKSMTGAEWANGVRLEMGIDLRAE